MVCRDQADTAGASLPARGAWIEIPNFIVLRPPYESPPARGAWIEISLLIVALQLPTSPPARGAWIEIF